MSELEKLRAVFDAGKRLRATAPVDDDFPSIMHAFDIALDNAGESIDTVAVSTTDEKEVNHYWGKDCPRGMVQVEFVGCSPNNKRSDYGWKPEKSAFIEVYVDGNRYRITVGDFHDGKAERRGLHVVTDKCDLVIEKTSLNAASLFFGE